MDSGRSSLSKRCSTDPLWDLLENLKQNPIPGLFYSSSTDNSVVLYDWWLVTSNVEGESKGLAVAGYIAKKESQFPFMSSPIVKRHDTYTLEAADGVTVKVEGMINQNKTRKNGFSHEQYIDSFADTTPTPGTNPSQILEQFETGTGNILNPNLESADPIGIDDDTLGDSPGIITTKEFEPQHEHGSISTDGKEAKEFSTPQKDGTLSDKKLPSVGRRKKAVAKVPDMSPTTVKRSSKKDHVPQYKTSGKGSRRANMVHGATDPLSESNIRRSRSGRAIIPPVDKGSQTVVYDQNGNFAGIATPIAVSTGSTSKPSRKKRRY